MTEWPINERRPASEPFPGVFEASSSVPLLNPDTNPGTVRVTDLRRLAVLTRGLKERIRSLLDLAPGQRVLDVGCGPGLDAADVALQVGPGGRVVGLDYDASMIREARCHAGRMGKSLCVSPTVANAACIPFLDRSFDRCYCERVLQHTPDAAAVVREMTRVIKPGGTIVVADTDWATLSIDTPEVASERALVRFVSETLCNGYAGRQLRRLLKDQGLADVHVELWPIVWTDYSAFRATSLSLLDMDRRAVQAGALSAPELSRFYETLASADRRSAFFASGAVVVARARKGRVGPSISGNEQEES